MSAGWQIFFQTTGSVTAALVGLLFLAVTLTVGRDTSSMSEGTKLFSTPMVRSRASAISPHP